MKTQEINIRDPYVLLHRDIYYLYGTRSSTCWGPADGFDCYTSRDLEDWEGPFEVFRRPEGFFADRKYWAPECYYRNGKFYLIATLASADRRSGVYALTADSPLGPFSPTGDQPLTPETWACIDGSIFWDENETPYLLFSHAFEDCPQGEMCALALTPNLTAAASAPQRLFTAAEAPWTSPVPFAKAEFGMDGDVYFSDGPCVRRRKDGSLLMLWTSWSLRGYAVGAAVSPSGQIFDAWVHRTETVFPENGGHGMLFLTREGDLRFTLHYPNDRFQEHPVFKQVPEELEL